MQVIGLILALSIAGCYTQVGSVRGEGEGTEEYQQPPQQGYYETPADSNYSGGQLPSPYYRFSFGYYYPSYYWGWYNDPFFSACYDPFSYNPWICGTPFVTYGYPGWYYGNYGFGYPYYGAGYYYYPRGHYVAGGAFGGTRNFGTTRGLTRGPRDVGPTREIGYVPPPAIPVSVSGTSTVTSPAGSRGSTPATTTNAGSGRTDRDARTQSTVGQGQGQNGGRNTGSVRGGTRLVRRRSIFPPQYIPPANVSPPSRTGNQGKTGGGGRGSSAPRAPQSAPSYSPPSSAGSHGGGSRGGSSGGGGGSRGSGGRSGGGSRGR